MENMEPNPYVAVLSYLIFENSPQTENDIRKGTCEIGTSDVIGRLLRTGLIYKENGGFLISNEGSYNLGNYINRLFFDLSPENNLTENKRKGLIAAGHTEFLE